MTLILVSFGLKHWFLANGYLILNWFKQKYLVQIVLQPIYDKLDE